MQEKRSATAAIGVNRVLLNETDLQGIWRAKGSF
jgi:hypothetical protein